MCRGFCKETQKAPPNYSAVVLGVKASKPNLSGSAFITRFSFIGLGNE
jgi:hypothetical protein